MVMHWSCRSTFRVSASLQAAVRGSVRHHLHRTGQDRLDQPALGLRQYYSQLRQPCLQPTALSVQACRLLTSSTAASGSSRSSPDVTENNESSSQASSDSGNHGDVNNDKASTPLAHILHSDILYSGPVTVADYMRQCLTHPLHGYYTTTTAGRIFGRRGDFVTAPQVSAVFSELLGVWLAAYLRAVGGHFRLVEFGPGCGSLQRAMLPTLVKLGCVPESVHLVDASETLRDKQKEMLTMGAGMKELDIRWYRSTDEVMAELEGEGDDDDDGGGQGTGKSSNTETTGAGTGIKTKTKPVRTMFIAHEFFDALPVHVFQRVASSTDSQPVGSPLSPLSSSSSSSAISAWREVLVDIDPTTTTTAATTVPPPTQTPQPKIETNTSTPTQQHDEHRLRSVLSKGVTPASALLSPASAGGIVHPESGEDVIEVCAQGISLARRMARLVARECDGGAALIVDYGGMQRRGMTLRAISRHAQNLPFLTRPGEVDLTADVDFGALQRAAEEPETGARFHGAVIQRDFLLRMGIAQRMRNVAKHIIDTGLRTTIAEGEGEGEDEIKRRRKKEEEEVDCKLSRLQSDYDRLVGTTEQDMGAVYKVAAICGRDVGSLPGFE